MLQLLGFAFLHVPKSQTHTSRCVCSVQLPVALPILEYLFSGAEMVFYSLNFWFMEKKSEKFLSISTSINRRPGKVCAYTLPTLTLVLANQMMVCILGDGVWHLRD